MKINPLDIINKAIKSTKDATSEALDTVKKKSTEAKIKSIDPLVSYTAAEWEKAKHWPAVVSEKLENIKDAALVETDAEKVIKTIVPDITKKDDSVVFIAEVGNVDEVKLRTPDDLKEPVGEHDQLVEYGSPDLKVIREEIRNLLKEKINRDTKNAQELAPALDIPLVSKEFKSTRPTRPTAPVKATKVTETVEPTEDTRTEKGVASAKVSKTESRIFEAAIGSGHQELEAFSPEYKEFIERVNTSALGNENVTLELTGKTYGLGAKGVTVDSITRYTKSDIAKLYKKSQSK